MVGPSVRVLRTKLRHSQDPSSFVRYILQCFSYDFSFNILTLSKGAKISKDFKGNLSHFVSKML